jgi:hypothetical protein
LKPAEQIKTRHGLEPYKYRKITFQFIQQEQAFALWLSEALKLKKCIGNKLQIVHTAILIYAVQHTK